MTRSLFIVAGTQLTASLREQFEAHGGFALRLLAAGELAAPWPEAVLLDAAACDAPALAARLRENGFAGVIVAIVEGLSPCREADATLSRPFRFADLLGCLDAPRGVVDRLGAARLTEKEAAILERLTRAGGAAISKATLLAEVWGYGPNVSTRTLETHIHRLRRKIETDASHPRRLLTEDGGYRLVNI